METNMKIALVAFLTLSVGAANAQTDSVRVRQNSTTTSTTEVQMNDTAPVQNQQPVQTRPQQTQQQQPATTPATVAPAATAADVDNDDNDYVLRHGELGIRYMPTFSSLRVRDAGGNAIQGQLSMSHGWGIMGAFNFNHHVGIQAEINYHQINQKYKDQGLDRQVNVSYLNIPVLLSLNTDKAAPVNVNFVVGPQFGFNIGASVSGDSSGNTDEATATVGAKGGDVGAAYGAGLEFMLNDDHTLRFDVGFRGYYGLIDMSADQTSSNPDTYNVLLSASRKAYSGYIGLTFLF